jgi:hypothetical protein
MNQSNHTSINQEPVSLPQTGEEGVKPINQETVILTQTGEEGGKPKYCLL